MRKFITVLWVLSFSALGEEIQGFDFSGQATLSGCSASLIHWGQSDSSKAVLLTNAHCVGMLSVPPETVFRDRPFSTHVRLYKDRQETVSARSERILFSTIHTFDLALVELNTTYGELAQKGVRSRRLRATPLAVGSSIILASGAFESVTRCNIEAIVPFIREDIYRNANSYKYRGCDDRHGTSGSPLINEATGEVVGLNYTGNDDGEECTYDNPCEVDENGQIHVDKGASYGDPVHPILTCVNEIKELDLDRENCELLKDR